MDDAIKVPREPPLGYRINALDADGRLMNYWVRDRQGYWDSRSGVGYTWASILEGASVYGWHLQFKGP